MNMIGGDGCNQGDSGYTTCPLWSRAWTRSTRLTALLIPKSGILRPTQLPASFLLHARFMLHQLCADNDAGQERKPPMEKTRSPLVFIEKARSLIGFKQQVSAIFHCLIYSITLYYLMSVQSNGRFDDNARGQCDRRLNDCQVGGAETALRVLVQGLPEAFPFPDAARAPRCPCSRHRLAVIKLYAKRFYRARSRLSNSQLHAPVSGLRPDKRRHNTTPHWGTIDVAQAPTRLASVFGRLSTSAFPWIPRFTGNALDSTIRGPREWQRLDAMAAPPIPPSPSLLRAGHSAIIASYPLLSGAGSG